MAEHDDFFDELDDIHVHEENKEEKEKPEPTLNDEFINDNSLSDNPDDFIQGIRDDIKAIQDTNIEKDAEEQNTNELEEYNHTLKLLREKLDNITLPKNIDEPEEFLLKNIKKNIGELEIMLEDLLVFMYKNQKSPTPGVLKTISKLVDSKTSNLELLAKYLNDKAKVNIEREKVGIIGGSYLHSPGGESPETDRPTGHTSLNDQIDQYMIENNGEKVEFEEVEETEEEIVKKALSVEQIDNGTAPSADILAKQSKESIETLEEEDE